MKLISSCVQERHQLVKVEHTQRGFIQNIIEVSININAT